MGGSGISVVQVLLHKVKCGGENKGVYKVLIRGANSAAAATAFTSSHLALFYVFGIQLFCDSQSIYCHPHPVPAHLVFSFHTSSRSPPTSASDAFHPLCSHRLLLPRLLGFVVCVSPATLFFIVCSLLPLPFCHFSSLVSFSHFSFWSWLISYHDPSAFPLSVRIFPHCFLKLFHLPFTIFFSYRFSDPMLLINIYHYNPFLTFPISLCFSFISFCLSSITLFTPCVVGTLADSSLFPGTAIWIRHLLASVCCLLTGWPSCFCMQWSGLSFTCIYINIWTHNLPLQFKHILR